MAYTHRMEINYDSKIIEADIVFDGGQVPAINFYSGMELSLPEMYALEHMLACMAEFYRIIGGFRNIEVVPK